MKTLLIALASASLATCQLALADSVTTKKDAAGYTHYYDSKGSQRCVSKKDAAGYVHYNCN